MPAEKKPAPIEFAVNDVPRQAYELAASATKDGCRLQPSAVPDFAEYMSDKVARHDITIDPMNGAPLSAKGQNLQEMFSEWEETRPFVWMPKAVSTSEEKLAEIWQSGNRTIEAQRFKAISELPGVTPAGAMTMWLEEKAKYQSDGKNNPGQTDKPSPAALSSNPWSAKFNGTEQARAAKIASICKMGTKLANDLAKSAGTTVGRPLTK